MRFKPESMDANSLKAFRLLAEANALVGLLIIGKRPLHCKILNLESEKVLALNMKPGDVGEPDIIQVPLNEIVGFFPSILETFCSIVYSFAFPGGWSGRYTYGFPFNVKRLPRMPRPSFTDVHRIRSTFKRELLKDKPLYVDWDWLNRIAGGVNSIGGGYVVSGSVSWKTSLFGMFWKKMKKLELVSLKDLDTTECPSEFRFKTDRVKLYSNRTWVLSMEGCDWHKGWASVADGTTIPCYFKAGDSLLYPLKWLRYVPGPFILWGELMPAGRSLQVLAQTYHHFVKVRGMATT